MPRHSLLITVVLLVLLVSPVTLVYAYSWIFLDSDPTGEAAPPGDITDLYFYNDGTYAYFKEELVAAPDIASYTYTVYLDKPAGGTYPQDYRIVYSSGASKLQNYSGSWADTGAPVIVMVGTSPPSITFTVAFSDVANPDVQQDTGIRFVNYQGANSFTTTLDAAPDYGNFVIYYEVIPELPWPTPLIFIPAVAATIFFIYKRRSKKID